MGGRQVEKRWSREEMCARGGEDLEILDRAVKISTVPLFSLGGDKVCCYGEMPGNILIDRLEALRGLLGLRYREERSCPSERTSERQI